MCGMAGCFEGIKDYPEVIKKMTSVLRHRGPDAEGYWQDKKAGIVLGHRRLSILDLSPAGHQPMRSPCGRYVIVYNGEVYNYRQIRSELIKSGFHFKGGSDTEVILAAVTCWGVERALERFIGMFALALWDCKERALYLVRDRLGIKPLYFGKVGGSFVFASELKPFLVLPDFHPCINRKALALYLRHNCVPAPESIFEGIEKLPPGYIAVVKERGKHIEKKQYWSAVDVAIQGLQEPFDGTEDEAIEQLEELLKEAVSSRMIADVPLGAFLSGGIDSSTVVALMQAHSGRPVKTFSIGNTIEAFDEAKEAASVARYLGTEHFELYVKPGDAIEVIPRLPEIYDEPFADSSQIPTFLVSRLAKEEVTVALSGDGGDELFGGYNRHVWGPRIWRRIEKWPLQSRRILAATIETIPPRRWDALIELASRFSKVFSHRQPGYKMQKLAEVLKAESPAHMYEILTSHWQQPEKIVRGFDGDGRFSQALPIPRHEKLGFLEFLMLADLITYLPNDILTKVDRASMAVSLEARVPLIDHRVVEFAWRLPAAWKIRNGKSKWILRRILAKYVPEQLWDRPKSGFGLPIVEWLRGPLRDWSEALLNESRLKSEGIFFYEPIVKAWQEHLSGKRNNAYLLWDILIFQAWHERNL